MFRIDLHLHSNHSNDGEYPPGALIDMAKAVGLDCVALADHNTTAGVDAAIAAGEPLDVDVVPAVELDCRSGDLLLHVLGYFINHRDKRYLRLADEMVRQDRESSAIRVAKVRALGVHLDDARLEAVSRNAVITSEGIAEAALADPRNDSLPLLAPYRPGGARSDNPYVNFYWDFCSPGQPANVSLEVMDLREAVDTIHATGGVAVMAHPGITLGDRENKDFLFADICAHGLDGVEVYCSYHDGTAAAYWLAQAELHNLTPTCGSDFHGKTKPSVAMGGHGFDGDGKVVLGGLLGRTPPDSRKIPL